MRALSTATAAEVAAGVNRPAYFVEIQFATQAVRLCTYGTLDWNGVTWTGGGIDLGDFDTDGRPQRIVLIDPTAAYRTLVLTDGIRDRKVQVWKGYVGALAPGDPVALFVGYGDQTQIANGKVTLTVDWNASARQFSPREVIGPGIGCNFLAPPGYTLTWGNQTLVMQGR